MFLQHTLFINFFFTQKNIEKDSQKKIHSWYHGKRQHRKKFAVLTCYPHTHIRAKICQQTRMCVLIHSNQKPTQKHVNMNGNVLSVAIAHFLFQSHSRLYTHFTRLGVMVANLALMWYRGNRICKHSLSLYLYLCRSVSFLSV